MAADSGTRFMRCEGEHEERPLMMACTTFNTLRNTERLGLDLFYRSMCGECSIRYGILVQEAMSGAVFVAVE